jgi:hypothetical protein
MAPGNKPDLVTKSKQKTNVKSLRRLNKSTRPIKKRSNENIPDASNYDDLSRIQYQEDPYNETELSVTRGLSVNSDSELDSDSNDESDSSDNVESDLDDLFRKLEMYQILLSAKIVFKKDLQGEPVNFEVDLNHLLDQ